MTVSKFTEAQVHKVREMATRMGVPADKDKLDMSSTFYVWISEEEPALHFRLNNRWGTIAVSEDGETVDLRVTFNGELLIASGGFGLPKVILKNWRPGLAPKTRRLVARALGLEQAAA